MPPVKIIPAALMTVAIITQVHSWDKELQEVDPKCQSQEYDENNRFFCFPGDGNGKIYIIDTFQPMVVTALVGEPNTYWLYTRQNPKNPQELKINDEESVVNSNFDPSKTTVFLTHGWKGNRNNTFNQMLYTAFLEDGDVNVIVVDYSTDADMFYTLAVQILTEVGSDLGKFINWMTSLGLVLEKTHLVGFSLGAHVVGMAGRYNNGNIRRITGLDPAGPLWYDNSDRLKKSDAIYVEVIHTNMLVFGYNGRIGDADFYPNGGSFMPECNFVACSHSKAYIYMAQTVRLNNLIANECLNTNQVGEDTCAGAEYPMGNSDLNKNRTGIFRVDTVASRSGCDG